MGAIALSSCGVFKKSEGEVTAVLIVTPSTADSDDTIDVSTLVTDNLLLSLESWDVSSGNNTNAATYTVADGTITIDPSGGQTDQTFAITLRFVDHIFSLT